MAHFGLVQATAIICTVLLGFCWPLLGQLQRPLSQRLGLAEDRLAAWQRYFTLLLVPAYVVSGLVQDWLGGPEVLFAGTLLIGLGISGLAGARQFRTALLAGLCLELGGCCLTTACTVLLPRAFPARGSPAAALNLGFCLAGVGALLAPRLLSLVLQRLGLRQGLLWLAFLCLVPASSIALTPTQDFLPPHPAGVPVYLGHGLPILLLAAVFILYWCLEWSFPLWLPRYLPEVDHPPRMATLLLAAFWALFLGARLGSFWLLPPGYERWFLASVVFVVVVVLGNLITLYSPSGGGWALLLLAFCLGPVLPTLLGVALLLEPQAPATAIGSLYALATLAGFIEVPLLKTFASSHSVRRTMRIPLVLAMIMVMPLLLLALLK